MSNLFELEKNAFDGNIEYLENAVAMAKKSSEMATTSEDLERAKVFLLKYVKDVEYNLSKIVIREETQNHTK